MNITIPIYIELLPQGDSPSPIYQVRPLFFVEPIGRDEELQRAITKFVKSLKRDMDVEGRKMRHDALASISFAPEIEDQMLSLSLDLKSHTAHCKFLFVTLNGLDRRLAFTPSLPDLWFDIERGEDLQARATDVLTTYFKGKGKPGTEVIPKPEELSVGNKAWASAVELDITPPLIAKTPREEFRALISGGDTMDGDWELQQVGRCLNWMPQDDLKRVIAREKEVEELTKLLKSADMRPTLLAGPRMVGKTAIIEEYVYRTISKQKSQFRSKENVWLIAPQRLISGMSYVGQWENRLLAIIDEAKKRKHILYFDDLVGLFKAGISRDSNLNAAQVLKPYIERREIRVLGEITREAWRVLREQDRGFADLFHLLPVTEPGEDTTLEMLIGLTRQLEHQHRCRFSIESLPTALDLQRRYIREAAFPGKAAVFLQQLAVKYRGAEITREAVLGEFQAKSGLAPWFLGNNPFSRADVVENLGDQVIGQPAVIDAIADVVSIARARLNDPERPFASLLFLGPTGVGKTQCAKSLAQYLFGDAERLIRFDMNEFNSGGSVTRLVGTFDQPDGLLTNAVRRQPFSVILLDEIEKAHPDLFNLLLQVMSDGRLTDALGRTSDFTNVILIMTSNLGVKEANSELGFSMQQSNESSIYRQAAEKFFSPEFFNRIDRIVPFSRLNREAIKRIANGLIVQLFQREGLARRRCALHVSERALERIIDTGFHPQLGARALKRAIESELTQPVARYLSSFRPATPTVVNVLSSSAGLRIDVQELVEAQPSSPVSPVSDDDPQSILDRVDGFINRIEDEITASHPDGAMISLSAVQPQHLRYIALREQIRNLRRSCDWLRSQIESSRRSSTRLTKNYGRSHRRPQGYAHLDNRVRGVWRELFAAEDMHAYLLELTATARNLNPGFKDQVSHILRESALLATLAHPDDEAGYHQALFMIRFLQRPDIKNAQTIVNAYMDLFGRQLGMETAAVGDETDLSLPDRWFIIRGWRAVAISKMDEGTQLFVRRDSIDPARVRIIGIEPQTDPMEVIKEARARYDHALNLDADAAELKFDPVIRIHNINNPSSSIDLRSGLTVTDLFSTDKLRALMLSAIPLPAELMEDGG